MADTAGDSDEDDDEARRRVDITKFMNSTLDLRPYLKNEKPRSTQHPTANDSRTVRSNSRSTVTMTSRIGWPITNRDVQDHTITQRSNTYRNVYDNGPLSVPNIPIFHDPTSPPAPPPSYLTSQISSTDRIMPWIHSFQSATNESSISSEPSAVLPVLSSSSSSVIQAQWQESPCPPEPFTPIALIPQEQNSPYPAEPTRNHPNTVDANVAVGRSNNSLPDSEDELKIQRLKARKDNALLVLKNRRLVLKNRRLVLKNRRLVRENRSLSIDKTRLVEQNEGLIRRNEILESWLDAFNIMARDGNGVEDMI